MSNTIDILPNGDDILSYTAGLLIRQTTDLKNDLSGHAVVFPGKRPAYYLRRLIAEKIRDPFFPPHIFSITEFMGHIADKELRGHSPADPLDSAYYLFECVKAIQEPSFAHAGDRFSHFVYWGLELYKTIDELDKWLVDNDVLRQIKVGLPEIPDHVLGFINNLADIRTRFHEMLKDKRKRTPGLDALSACRIIGSASGADCLNEFEHIYFTDLIAPTKAEAQVIRTLLSSGHASFSVQYGTDASLSSGKIPAPWVKTLQVSLGNADIHYIAQTAGTETKVPQPLYHEAFDTHAEVFALSSILSESNDPLPDNRLKPDDIAIVLPTPEPLIPALTHVLRFLDADLNITMGYPLKRTPLYALLDSVLDAQGSKKEDDGYYAPGYLKVIRHPYVKGLFDGHARTLVHQIEEYITARHLLFFRLDELEDKRDLFESAADRIAASVQQGPSARISGDDLHGYLKTIHSLFFSAFEPEQLTPMKFAECVYAMIESLAQSSNALDYLFSPSYVNYFAGLLDTWKSAEFSGMQMDRQKLYDMFRYYAGTQSIPFDGTPLKGIQIMGMLETRSLRFKKVIIFDCNEGILPPAGKYEPILPLRVKQYLHLPTYRDHEALSRYHFKRLISAAENVHLIYKKNEASVRSRFLEELIWEEEKAKGRLDASDIRRYPFKTDIRDIDHTEIKKDGNMVKLLERIVSEVSPTTVDTYLNCPMKFYYTSILCLSKQEELEQDIEAKDIGTYVHDVLHEFYKPYIGRRAPAGTASEIGKLGELVDKRFARDYRYTDRGPVYLIKEISKHLLGDFIKKDIEKQMEILGCETPLHAPLDLGGATAGLKGRADRIDRRGDEIVIVDYKTGSRVSKPDIKKLQERTTALEKRQEMKDLIGSFQLPVYLDMYHEQNKNMSWGNMNAVLSMIRENREILLFTPHTDETMKGHLMEDILIPSLKNLLSEILNPDVPFVCDDSDDNACKYCPFSTMCG